MVKAAEANSKLHNIRINQLVNNLHAEFTKKEVMGVTITKKLIIEIAEGKGAGADFYKFCEQC